MQGPEPPHDGEKFFDFAEFAGWSCQLQATRASAPIVVRKPIRTLQTEVLFTRLPCAALATHQDEGSPVVGQIATVACFHRSTQFALRFAQCFVLLFPPQPLLVKQRHQLLSLLVRN